LKREEEINALKAALADQGRKIEEMMKAKNKG
jgi:hypothetical protein